MQLLSSLQANLLLYDTIRKQEICMVYFFFTVCTLTLTWPTLGGAPAALVILRLVEGGVFVVTEKYFPNVWLKMWFLEEEELVIASELL